jgi:hypothetical protein
MSFDLKLEISSGICDTIFLMVIAVFLVFFSLPFVGKVLGNMGSGAKEFFNKGNQKGWGRGPGPGHPDQQHVPPMPKRKPPPPPEGH